MWPTNLPPTSALNTPNAPNAPNTTATGKILDVDGDTLLIGLGAGDGLKVGDVLTITLEGGIKVRAAVTKVRPRTCDAQFDKSATPAQRARVLTGQTAVKARTQVAHDARNSLKSAHRFMLGILSSAQCRDALGIGVLYGEPVKTSNRTQGVAAVLMLLVGYFLSSLRDRAGDYSRIHPLLDRDSRSTEKARL